MNEKYSIPEGEQAPESQIGASLECLAATISSRRNAGEDSYTYKLLGGNSDKLLKKVMEEAGEVALAAKDVDALIHAEVAHGAVGLDRKELLESMLAKRDDALNHLRYESADVIYHLLVVLERYGISVDELAAELNARMEPNERPEGAALLHADQVNRG